MEFWCESTYLQIGFSIKPL